MAFTPYFRVGISALAALFLSASGACAQISPTAFAELEKLRLAPESAGVLIYRGETFAQRLPSGPALYRYERRVVSAVDGLTASHLTRDPTGRLILAESSSMSQQYRLQRFEVLNQQQGFSGLVVVSHDGRHLTYELNDNGNVSTTSEAVSEPVVSGPSLFGFILAHWDSLQAGATIPVRMIVIQEKTTYGFDLKFERLVDRQASFTITPSSFLIRLAVAPLRVVFDASTRHPIRYEGRVPPMENVAGKLKALDARVDYTPISSAYR
jgi:hypothetical protein